MKTKLNIAFNPLIDAAPIIIAKEKGFFSDEGLDVTLEREISWSNIRDKLAYGLIDAAHLLFPIPYASTIGLGPDIGNLQVALNLSMGGNSLVLKNELYNELKEKLPANSSLKDKAVTLKNLLDEKKQNGGSRLIIGIPFVYSTHLMVINEFIALSGAEPEKYIQTLVFPPSKMTQMLREGLIDGFIAGAPWPETTQLNNEGAILFSDPEYWDRKPEKVLAIRQAWADENPLATRVLIRAMIMAGKWCADEANKKELISIISRPEYVNANEKAIEIALSKDGSGLIFDPNIVSIPDEDQEKWVREQLQKWNNAPANDATPTLLANIDLWNEVARTCSLV